MGEGSEYGICEGLERAIEKFKKGEKSRIVLKPKYAFKSEGNPALGIPPDAVIEYEVELKNFEKVGVLCWGHTERYAMFSMHGKIAACTDNVRGHTKLRTLCSLCWRCSYVAGVYDLWLYFKT